MSHTKEPWCIGRDDRPGMEWNNHIIAANDHNQTICFMTHDNTPDNEEGEANARRIVACVNALAHIPTEELESGRLQNLVLRCVDAEKQRDELLAALEWVHLIFTDDTLSQERDPELWTPSVSAAIASVKGGA